jgi:mono/diheme cytochrome c family protein
VTLLHGFPEGGLEMKGWLLVLSVVLAAGGYAAAGERNTKQPSTPAERGREALLTRSFAPAVHSFRAYDNVWKQWGLKEKPADYGRAFRDRYGLFSAPYPNDSLPMGLRKADGFLGKGIGNDCLLCHAGRIAGQTILGLGNASIDLMSLFEEMQATDGIPKSIPFTASNVRGTIEVEAVLAYLMQFRDADLNLRLPVKLPYRTNIYADIPAWWHLKKKKTMFHTGAVAAAAVRANMTFMLSPLNSGAYIKKQEPVFRDIKAYLMSIESPHYPFPVDTAKADRGRKVFVETCARCHGTYGPNGKYPNKLVDLETIGTDPTAVEGYSSKSIAEYKKSWFNQEKGPDGNIYEIHENRGYQAPPLDGVWATAPYFHNGSVPTVYHVLNSKARPKVYTRSFGTEKEDYDPARLGWRITLLDRPPDPKLPAFERRKITDTTRPGHGNFGHTFGDKLSEDDRMAVIEYLKTL